MDARRNEQGIAVLSERGVTKQTLKDEPPPRRQARGLTAFGLQLCHSSLI